MADHNVNLGSVKQPEKIQGMVATLRTQNNYLHNFLSAGLVFVMLVVAYNWKDFQKAITRSDIETHSITILGEDGKPLFVLNSLGLTKTDGKHTSRIIANYPTLVELKAELVDADKVTAKKVDGEEVKAKDFVYVDKDGRVTKIQEHLTTKKTGDQQ